MRRNIVRFLAGMSLVPGAAYAVYVAPAFPNLPPLDSPIDIQDPLDGTDRLFVTERDGLIYVFQNDVSVTQFSLFLDIGDSVTTQTEGGLLGLAFHPDYEANGFFYVTYTHPSPRRTILSRFSASAGDPNVADPLSELRLIELRQSFLHHKGGCLAFGPDGYLYLSLGDDGISSHSQNLTRLEGKVLRIDVDNPSGGKNYGIPPDNPFAGSPNGERAEIFAFGFRNPWRFSFDPPTGRLWLGDVGQDTWEEINLIRKGRNYGWPRMEGNECYSPPSCDTTGLNLVAPLHVYEHVGSASITGGRVYRGTAVPSLDGKYVYTDFVDGRIWALEYDGVNPPVTALIDPGTTVSSVSSFGVDKDGEVFFTSFAGAIYRFFETSTGVRPPGEPAGALTAAFPNPFMTSVSLEYDVTVPGRVTLEVFDVRGRRVATLVDATMEAGARTAVWNGRDASHRPVPGGVYFARLSAGATVVGAKKIVLAR